MDAPAPQVGDTVLIIDPNSNYVGKAGRITRLWNINGGVSANYGVTFWDNVLRYFSREGFSLQTEPIRIVIVTEPRPEFHITGYVQHGYTAGFGELTIRGNAADLFALAAELVKRG